MHRIWHVQLCGKLVLRHDRAYEWMDSIDLRGVNEAQRAALKALGAVERADATKASP